MALTRIENNQISNAVSGNTEVGINGNLKLQEYTVTGSRLANNLNYGSDFTVTGNITGGNVATSGQVSATGSLTGGNIFTTGQVSATGNVTGNYILGNIACATGYTSNTIYNGSSNVLIATANGNITMSVDGTPNVAVVTSSGLQVSGTASASGNITGGNINTLGLVNAGELQTSGNAIVGGDLVVNGNLTYVNVTDLNIEDPIIGLGRGPNNAPLTTNDGKDRGEQLWYYSGSEKSAFTGYDNSAGKLIMATDVTINNEIVTVNDYGNFVVGNLEGTSSSVTGSASAGNVFSGGVVSAVGTVTGGYVYSTGELSAAGNVEGSNLRTAGTVSATGNVTGGNIRTSGNVDATSAFVNAGAVLASGRVEAGTTMSAGGNITGNSNILAGGFVSAVGNVIGDYILGNIACATGYTSNTIYNGTSNILIGSANGNITMSVDGTPNVVVVTSTGINITSTVSASGDVTGANILTGGAVSASGTVTGGNLATAGTVSATGNITGGNISTTGSGGDITGGGNINAGGYISATGNIIANSSSFFIGNGSQLTGVAASSVNANALVGNTLSANVIFSSLETVGTLANLSVSGNTTSGNLATGGTVSAAGNIIAATNLKGGNVLTDGIISATGTATAGNVLTGGIVSATSTIQGGEILTAGNVSATGSLTGGNIFTGGQISATSTITGGNLATGGSVTATGDVTGGNLITAGSITATGTATAGNVLTGGLVSATGNLIGGNVFTGGDVSATGNVTSAATVSGANITTTGVVSATGNVQAGNILTGGLISATGNISGNFYSGNGRQLTGQGMSYRVTAANNQAYLVNGGYPNTTITLIRGQTYLFEVAAINHPLWIKTDPVIGTGNAYSSGVTNNGAGTGTVGFQVPFNAPSTLYYQCQFHNGMYGMLSIVDGSVIQNGNSNVQVYGNGNVTTSVGGTANVTTVTSSGIQVSGTISSTGNITGGNIDTAGVISATGNITGNYFIGNGAFLTGIDANQIKNGDSNVRILTANGNISMDVNGTSNVVVVTDAGIEVDGTVSAVGNITGQNFFTAGDVSATGDVYANNTRTSNVISTGQLEITSGSNGNILIQPNGSGNIVLANTYINSVRYPVQNQDAASKEYVDNMVSAGISYHEPVFAATTTDLATATGGTITYTQPNGASNGIGATITTTGSFNLIDTANVQTANTRILVKNEGNAVLNGVYYWANSTAIIRTSDTDQYGSDSAEAFGLNDYFFVQNGNVNKGSAFVVSAPTGTITFGTSNIQFAQFSSSQTYTANTLAGITLTGTVFSAEVDNNTTAFDLNGNIIVKAGANLTTPNIGAATGTSLSVTGNVNSGNVISGGQISAVGTAHAGNLHTSGIVTATGNIIGANLITSGSITATGTITSADTITGGNLATGGTVSATGTVTGGNIATGGTVSATGTVTGGNVDTAGTVSATGNITGGNLITSGAVTASGAVTGSNIYTAGEVSATGNITAGPSSFFIGNGSLLTGVTATGVDAGNLTGNTLSSNVIFSSLQTVGTLTSLSVTGNIDGGNIKTAGQVSATGNVTGGNILFDAGVVSGTGSIFGGNVFTGGVVSATGTGTFGNLATAGTVSATGTIQGGNILTAGDASAGGTVTGGNIVTGGSVSAVSTVTGGNIATAGFVTATGNIDGGNIKTGGLISATGTATVGNVVTGGIITATGNISTASNFIGNLLFGAGIISGTGNIYANQIFANITGNIVAPGSNTEIIFNDEGIDGTSPALTFNKASNTLAVNGFISATGNISGNYFFGNGSQLTGIITSVSNVINGNSNIDIASPGSNITVSVNGTANIATFTAQGIELPGNVSASSYILGSNAVFGTSLIPVTGATLTINATDSMLMPVGNTAQRPSGAAGMVRYNNQTNKLEVYNGTSWVNAGGDFTVISDDQFAGDGSTVVFTLSTAQTTYSVIVSINGVVQIPDTAYTVSGTTLTFSEAPAPGDDIDVRGITTTTTVTGISNNPGNAQVITNNTSNVVTIIGQLSGSGNALTIQGDLTVTGNATITGNISGSQISNGNSRVQIPSANGNVNIDVGATDNMAVFASDGMFVTGNVSVTGDVTAQNVNSLSDATLKTNITPIVNAGAVIDALQGVGYDWTDGSGHAYGHIAQAVEEILPEAVKTDANGIKSINYNMVVPFLVETVKELRQDIAEIKAQLNK